MKTAAAVYALTRQGIATAAKLAAFMDMDVYAPSSLGPVAGAEPFDSLPALVARTFSAYRRHIFIAAAGAAVRCIAPHIRGKNVDPAVVVLDHHGRHVISLLSGHLGGANALAGDVAAILGGRAVITTATDTENLPSFDILALERGMAIADIRAVASVNAALLAGRPVIVDDPHNYLRLRDSVWKERFLFAGSGAYAPPAAGEQAPPARVTVTPSLAPSPPDAAHLVLHPKILHAGIGCRRGTRAGDIVDIVTSSFARLELAPGALAGISSADIKRNERGLLDAAAALHAPLRFFSAEELRAVSVSSPSPKAREVLGVNGVCEPAAILAAGANARLRMPKLVRGGVTVAIAQENPFHG